jgi:glucosamine--fructose-6-phosphate aminotransferase (isomerizing)
LPSSMLEEALEAPAAVQRQLGEDAPLYRAIGAELRARPPQSMLTVARGSSDHAAHFLAYLVMARLGRLVTSLPMSLITLYATRLQCDGLVAMALSQSGRSPDLIAPIEFVGAHGARTIAWINETGSPLARAARWALDLRAGEERSVAATKSYIAQLAAGARLVAAWQDDASLTAALARLPEALARAARADWSPLAGALLEARRMLVIGRGLGLAIAMEAALKLKETCGIHAEAFSGAEVRHGPMALIEPGYPVLIFAPRGPAQADLLALADDLRMRGAQVLLAAPSATPGALLALEPAAAEDLDPITAIQSFYPAVEALARARGADPDRPPHLAKVTATR